METITLKNFSYDIQVSPLGARMTHIRTPKGENWLWEPVKKPVGVIEKGSNYDDNWQGGFEELFPNDAAGDFEGRTLLDHGELWSTPWDIQTSSQTEIQFSKECTSQPASVQKKISLQGDAIQVDYQLQNKSESSFVYLFKLHPAMRLEEGDQLLLPGGTVVPVDLSFSSIIGSDGPFTWPWVTDKQNKKADLSLIPSAEAKKKEFIYVKDLKEGWCGLKRKRTGQTFKIEFPLSVFPYCWLFITYGGWRDHHTVVLEPCTNMPKDLTTAKSNGTAAVLKPKEKKSFQVKIKIYE